jgi:two-component system alkaline phosphatase synthesis response regulator PhoP
VLQSRTSLKPRVTALTARSLPLGVGSAPEAQPRRALVLHDQPPVVDLIQRTLNHGLFVVKAAHNLLEADASLARWQPHLVVVDMDHEDSTALLHRLATANTLTRSFTPALGLTPRADLATRLRAFELGVDDILTMPFVPDELIARALVLSRRAAGAERRPVVTVVKLGEVEVDIANREIRIGPSVTALSRIEQALLYLLASRAGRVVARDEILDVVWGPEFVAESNVVDRHIRSLRVKLNDDHRDPRFIGTVNGLGYRFIPTFSNAGWSGDASA